MEDMLQPIFSIYLNDKKGGDQESGNECKKCKKQIIGENKVVEKERKPAVTTKNNLSSYLYQSSNAICLQTPSLYSYSRKVPNYYLKE